MATKSNPKKKAPQSTPSKPLAEQEVGQQIAEQEVKKLKGRGGTNNFGFNKKELVKNEEDRNLVKKLLAETITAYHMPKVKSDEELAQRLSDYFGHCAEVGQIPTVEEMSLYTGYSSATIWDWEVGRNKGFSNSTSAIIKKAKEFLKSFDAKLAISGKLNFLTYCFRAKNYYGLTDKQEFVLTPNAQLNPSDPAQLSQKYDTVLPEPIEDGQID